MKLACLFTTVLPAVAAANAFRGSTAERELGANVAGCHNCPNPCVSGTAGADLYHPHCSDPAQYIQCTPDGSCSEKSCLPETIWNNEILSCVQDTDKCIGSQCKNPCVPGAEGEDLFYAHCNAEKTNKFRQCDSIGGCYVMICPQGLNWNDTIKTCVMP